MTGLAEGGVQGPHTSPPKSMEPGRARKGYLASQDKELGDRARGSRQGEAGLRRGVHAQYRACLVLVSLHCSANKEPE